MPKVISVHSYCGETGKSNLTINFAAAVAQSGYRVAAVDTEIPSLAVHHILGLELTMMTQTLDSYWGKNIGGKKLIVLTMLVKTSMLRERGRCLGGRQAAKRTALFAF